MELLEQCQLWCEQGEFQTIIDTLEAIPAEERTPEMDSELGRAYNAIGDDDHLEAYRKAIALLKPHEEHFQNDHCWNYRIASAYYYLDQEGPALHYFEKALEARPGDEDTQEYIEDCRRRLALPRFAENFRERTQNGWAAFVEIEGRLRAMMDSDPMHERGEELIALCSKALEVVFSAPAFELGFNGEKYELILSPEGIRSRLFPLAYFQRHAPESVLEHWNILVGRQPSTGFALRADGQEVRAEDVEVWVKKSGNGQVALTVYCEKLLGLAKENSDKAWWMLSTLTDQVLGEVAAIAWIDGFDVLAQPKEDPAILLSDLPGVLADMGLSRWKDAQDYLDNNYLAYELDPVQDPQADWRLDVFAGSACLPVLINDYLSACSNTMDEYHKDGIVAGFLCYPLDGFAGDQRNEAILDFRDALEETIYEQVGEDAVTFLGGATGLYCGYLDFIAWDLFEVLKAAQAFFEKSDLPWANFHTFRRDVGGVPLLDREEDVPDPEIHEETGSLLSPEDIETLQSFEDGYSGHFGRMRQWIEEFVEKGVQERRFSEKQARQDLQIALWYSFACNNLDEYLSYYRAARWMKDSEPNAAGCGTWYYRYSTALMYCGRLEEALEYAEKGAREQPEYPWIWLQLGRLRAHFGDKAGALEAAWNGLALEPGDYEFQTLEREIYAGATLEQMEWHWIDPKTDQQLQAGEAEAEEIAEKQCAIACIRVNEAGLADFYQLFHPEQCDYVKNDPDCRFSYMVQGHPVQLSFRMNEAGLSKLGTDWLRQFKNWLDHDWLTCSSADGPAGTLEAVFVSQRRRVELVYRQPGKKHYFRIFRDQDGSECSAAHFAGCPEPDEEQEQTEENSDLRGTFAGFVLLSRPCWSKEQLLCDLSEKWDIPARQEEDPTDSKDMLIFQLDNRMVTVSMMPAPIPDGEAETGAENNYLWPDAVKAAREHKAHIMVAVIGEETDLLELGKLYTKVLAACCRQKYATGVYASGVVFEPRFYEDAADQMKTGVLPIFNWVWFGLYQSESGLCGYTNGLEQFARDEIEVLNTDAQPEELHNFMMGIASYVLEYDVELHDGETIGFSAQDKHTITRSEGIALPGMTLKVSYEPMEDDE